MNRAFTGTKIGCIFILISILFVGSYGLVLPGNTYTANPEASITIDCSAPLPGEISPAIYGGFIEFIGCCINGPIGLWAQELRNRGFDELDEDENGISGQDPHSWQPLADSGVITSYALDEDGYNLNGVYSQQVTKIDGAGRVGLFQLISISGRSGLDFYIYLHGDSTAGEITVSITDMNGSHIYAQSVLCIPETEWKKATATFPPFPAVEGCRLEISWTGNGTVWLDEASLMPLDNINGVRREFFELYYEWQPGVLRYPGGCFADSPANHWEFGIGPVDQRQSPNWDSHWGAYQRIDFGTDEFVAFCKACNIEPHMTVNFGSGTVEEAVAWVEYCNGPSNSTYGAMRTANGHPEPYNVKYWEIGNEQYGDWEIGHTTPEEYGARFVEYYHAMKAVDPTIRIMADEDTNPEWYLPMMDAIEREIDVFGWHTCHIVYGFFTSDEDIYLSMLARSMSTERTIESFWNQAIESGLAPDMRLSISEWWPVYRYVDSTGMRVGSLESALWSALHLNVFQRHADAMETACRTAFIGVISSKIDTDTGSRIILATPTYYVFKMYRHYSGDHRLAVEVDCATYDTPGVPQYSGERDVPYLDASATMSNDSFYLAVVNRHPTDTMHTAIQWNGIAATEGTIRELSSDSYLNGNDWENPDKITINSRPWVPSEYYDFPPHSVTIIEISNSTETPFIDITRPKKSLYIQDKELMTLPKNTVIIGEITIRVNAYSEDGIDKVEFYIDNLLKETIDEEPYDWLWDERTFGTHEIKVIAYDNSGSTIVDEIEVIIFNMRI